MEYGSKRIRPRTHNLYGRWWDDLMVGWLDDPHKASTFCVYALFERFPVRNLQSLSSCLLCSYLQLASGLDLT